MSQYHFYAEKYMAQLARRRREAPQPLAPGCGLNSCTTTFPPEASDILEPNSCRCPSMKFALEERAAKRPLMMMPGLNPNWASGTYVPAGGPGSTYAPAQYTSYPPLAPSHRPPRPSSAAASVPYHPPAQSPQPYQTHTSSNTARVPPYDGFPGSPRHDQQKSIDEMLRNARLQTAASNGHHRAPSNPATAPPYPSFQGSPRSDDRIHSWSRDVPPNHPPETPVQPRAHHHRHPAVPPPAASNGHRRDVVVPPGRKSKRAPNPVPKAIPIPPTPLPIRPNGSIDTRSLVAVEEREYRKGKFGVYRPGR